VPSVLQENLGGIRRSRCTLFRVFRCRYDEMVERRMDLGTAKKRFAAAANKVKVALAKSSSSSSSSGGGGSKRKKTASVRAPSSSDGAAAPTAGGVVATLVEDVRTVWHNCAVYNAEGSAIVRMAKYLSSVTEEAVARQLLPLLPASDASRIEAHKCHEADHALAVRRREAAMSNGRGGGSGSETGTVGGSGSGSGSGVAGGTERSAKHGGGGGGAGAGAGGGAGVKASHKKCLLAHGPPPPSGAGGTARGGGGRGAPPPKQRGGAALGSISVVRRPEPKPATLAPAVAAGSGGGGVTKAHTPPSRGRSPKELPTSEPAVEPSDGDGDKDGDKDNEGEADNNDEDSTISGGAGGGAKRDRSPAQSQKKKVRVPPFAHNFSALCAQSVLILPACFRPPSFAVPGRASSAPLAPRACRHPSQGRRRIAHQSRRRHRSRRRRHRSLGLNFGLEKVPSSPAQLQRQRKCQRRRRQCDPIARRPGARDAQRGAVGGPGRRWGHIPQGLRRPGHLQGNGAPRCHMGLGWARWCLV